MNRHFDHDDTYPLLDNLIEFCINYQRNIFGVSTFDSFFDTISHRFGLPKWTQNGPKTGPEPKKCVRRRRRKRFLAFFRAVAVRSRPPDRFLEGPTFKMWPDHHTELDFQEIGFFEKNAENRPSGDPFWLQN